MSESIRPTKTRKLDEVIHKVNAKFDSKRKQKRVVKKYTSGSFLTAAGVSYFCFSRLCKLTAPFIAALVPQDLVNCQTKMGNIMVEIIISLALCKF